MSSYSLSRRRTVRILALVSSLFFWIFSFVYLGVFQNDLLAFRVDTLFSGKFAYNPWIGALVITFVLWMLQRLVSMLKWFGVKGYIFTYTPSFLMLGGITYYVGDYGLSLAACIFGGAMLFSFLLFAAWQRKSTKLTSLSVVNLNLQGLLFLCCLTVAIGNTDEDLHHELSMASAFNKGDYSKVLQIGEKSVSVSPEMAEYRIRALAATGQLGERLFDYPQYYTSLPVFSQQDANTRIAFDYSIAFMLLNRNLDGLYKEMSKSRDDSGMLPRYYAEAMVLYKHLHPELPFNFESEGLDKSFKTFLDFQSQLEAGQVSATSQENRMKREFGTTYWCYYMYN